MVMAFDCLSLKHIHSLSQQKQLFEHLPILVILNPGLRRLEIVSSSNVSSFSSRISDSLTVNFSVTLLWYITFG